MKNSDHFHSIKDLEHRPEGETVFTMKTPFPRVQRVAMEIVSIAMVVCMLRILQDVEHTQHSVRLWIFRIILYLVIGVWTIVGLAAFFRWPPFDPKKQQ